MSSRTRRSCSVSSRCPRAASNARGCSKSAAPCTRKIGVFPPDVIDYQIELLTEEDDEKLNRDFARLPAEERLVATRDLMHKDIHRH